MPPPLLVFLLNVLELGTLSPLLCRAPGPTSALGAPGPASPPGAPGPRADLPRGPWTDRRNSPRSQKSTLIQGFYGHTAGAGREAVPELSAEGATPRRGWRDTGAHWGGDNGSVTRWHGRARALQCGRTGSTTAAPCSREDPSREQNLQFIESFLMSLILGGKPREKKPFGEKKRVTYRYADVFEYSGAERSSAGAPAPGQGCGGAGGHAAPPGAFTTVSPNSSPLDFHTRTQPVIKSSACASPREVLEHPKVL